MGDAGEPAAGVGNVMAAGCGLLVAGSLAGAVIASAPSAREANLQPDRDSHESTKDTKARNVTGRGSRVVRAVTRPLVIPANAGIHEGLPAALHQPGRLGITKADKSPLPYPEAAPDLAKPNRWLIFSNAHDMREDGFVVRVYGPPREHPPPHVHVERGGDALVVTISHR
jgi:hypothetical protein